MEGHRGGTSTVSGGPTAAEIRQTGNALFQSVSDRTGGGLYPRSRVQRAIEEHEAHDSLEMRGVDVSMAALEAKYGEELAKAEKRMEERKEQWSEQMRLNVAYDYENDKRFLQWREDKARAQEALHIHPLDSWLDNIDEMLQYGVRFFSFVGGMHGAGRAIKLWRTVDQNYSKLHGVGFGSIFVTEFCHGIIRGGCVGGAWGVGNLVGDQTARMAFCAYEGTVVRQRRQWQNITSACAFGGIFAGILTCYFGRHVFSNKGFAMVMSGLTVTGTAFGAYVGITYYKPWTELYPESYDESPLPWHMRALQLGGGPTGIRGRYH